MHIRNFLRSIVLLLFCGTTLIFVNCEKKEDADLAFNFCNVGSDETVVGVPMALNTSIINEVYPGVKNSTAAAIAKDADASHRLISCEFRPDTLSLWVSVEMEDINGVIDDSFVREVDPIPSGKIEYYVDAIIFNEPGYYRFSVRLDCYYEVDERDESNNTANAIDLIRSSEYQYLLSVCVKGDAIPSKTKLKITK